jgi:hypothetical protein
VGEKIKVSYASVAYSGNLQIDTVDYCPLNVILNLNVILSGAKDLLFLVCAKSRFFVAGLLRMTWPYLIIEDTAVAYAQR